MTSTNLAEPLAERMIRDNPDKKNLFKDERLPVTVLSGFLGAGKTSVMHNLLHSTEHGLKMAVIVNDMAAVNVDAKAVVKVAPKLVAMQNGCICCTLREDLLQQVTELAREKDETDGSRKWDYLFIESTGISEPIPVAQTFVMKVAAGNEEHGHSHDHTHRHEENTNDSKQAEDGETKTPALPVFKYNPLLTYARLDTMVTVVDACNFFQRLAEIERIKDQPDAEGNEDENRTLADLMIDQVEFANVILLNKCDLMIKEDKAKELDLVEHVLKRLNPCAAVIRTSHGKVSHDKILNTHLFNMNLEAQSAGWLKELKKPAHTPETEEYGVSSMVFKATKPFHPRRLLDILHGFGDIHDEEAIFNGVLRSKGQIWLANAHAFGLMWHSAGYQFNLNQSASPFIARVLEDMLQVDYIGQLSSPEKLEKMIQAVFGSDPAAIQEIRRLLSDDQWSKEFGDRCQELVLIGVNLDKDRMTKELEKALLTDKEVKAGMKNLSAWKKLEDPFFGGKCAEMYFDLKKREQPQTK